jgi:hypothetical protein
MLIAAMTFACTCPASKLCMPVASHLLMKGVSASTIALCLVVAVCLQDYLTMFCRTTYGPGLSFLLVGTPFSEQHASHIVHLAVSLQMRR